MSSVFEEIAGLDKLVHEPARLAIMTILATSESADFLALQRLTGLTSGNLSVHLSKLIEGELITYDKQFVGKKPKTQIKITKKGQQALEKHWLQLENFRANIQKSKPE
jgi:DNA-binding MarR family transcriptional regulator